MGNYEFVETIAKFASRINDLHNWFRMNRKLDSRRYA